MCLIVHLCICAFVHSCVGMCTSAGLKIMLLGEICFILITLMCVCVCVVHTHCVRERLLVWGHNAVRSLHHLHHHVCSTHCVRWSEDIMLLGEIGINNLHLLSPVIPPRLKTTSLNIFINIFIDLSLVHYIVIQIWWGVLWLWQLKCVRTLLMERYTNCSVLACATFCVCLYGFVCVCVCLMQSGCDPEWLELARFELLKCSHWLASGGVAPGHRRRHLNLCLFSHAVPSHPSLFWQNWLRQWQWLCGGICVKCEEVKIIFKIDYEKINVKMSQFEGCLFSHGRRIGRWALNTRRSPFPRAV